MAAINIDNYVVGDGTAIAFGDRRLANTFAKSLIVELVKIGSRSWSLSDKVFY
ncbi:MAG: hypothetical protein PUP93_14545 [Rhizonema sp. NSF051]|nr:hypothetical protein [Rhizonema sp. NSF051]